MTVPTPLIVLVAATILTSGYVALMSWMRREAPGGRAFAVLMVCTTWWVATYTGEIVAPTLSAKLFWARLEWFTSVFVPVAWVVFAAQYTGHDAYLSRRRIALLCAIPVVSIVLVWTNGSHGLIRQSVGLQRSGSLLLLDQTYGPWFWVVAGYAVLLGAVGVALFGELLVSRFLLHRYQTAALLVAAMAPLGAFAVTAANLGPWPGVDYTPFAYAVSGVAGLWALERYEFLESLPVSRKRARQFLIDGMNDAVVVVDQKGRVLDFNLGAVDAFDLSPNACLGRQAATVLPPIHSSGTETSSGGIRDHVVVEKPHGRRYYDVRISNLSNDVGRVLGQIIVFHDVSELLLYQQRLEVLNRVLRHNLRNEMNVVFGYADLLTDGADVDRYAPIIREKALAIVNMGDKARQIAELLDDSHSGSRPVEVEPLVHRVAEAARATFPSVAVAVESAPANVYCHQAVAPILSNVVENAAQHNSNPEPAVLLGANASDESVTFEVVDNGPGIDEHERAVLDEGVETSLSHGSGLGLWLVKWGLTAVGGSVSFETADVGGTHVTITVPRRPPPPPEDVSDVQATWREGVESSPMERADR
ncbi:MAG: histidine kinase N-terminal 7TM domain-containing protein [Halobacteriota archaeon]